MIQTVDMTSDHIIGYGVRVGDGVIDVRIQWHPAIQAWLRENKIAPEYAAKELVEGYNVRISGFEKPGSAIRFKETELRNAKFEVDELLEKVAITATMTKKQAKFMFPVFRAIPQVAA